ncbi:MAG: hypothetical protein LBC63_07635 [Holophagales bacterium]|nr:hypothetical protein [Holophagales bacterium]
MKVHRIFRAGAAVALLGALAGAPGLLAQQDGESPYSYLFKLRAGLTAGDMQKTHFDNKVGGVGFEVRREMFGGGQALSAELTWEYATGRHYDAYPWGTNPGAILDHAGKPINPRYSVDDRKEYGAGLNLRFAYHAPLSVPFLHTEGLEWFAGLGIDRFKVRSEVSYTFNFQPNPSTGPTPGDYDGAAFLREESQISPGVFAGLKCRLNKDVGFELTLRNFGMWHMDYVPYSYDYKGMPPEDKLGKGTTTTGITRGTALEFAITLAF